MRENRTYGSEGGEDLVLPDPYPIKQELWERLQPRILRTDSRSHAPFNGITEAIEFFERRKEVRCDESSRPFASGSARLKGGWIGA